MRVLTSLPLVAYPPTPPPFHMKKCKKCFLDIPLSFFRINKLNNSIRKICYGCELKENNERSKVKNYWGKLRNKANSYRIGVRSLSRYGLELSLLVYERAKRKCELCNKKSDLTIHHKDGHGRHYEERGLKSNNDPNNLQVLCRRCHGSIEGKKGQEMFRKKRELICNFR